jgi:uncharacterized membrane protein
MSRRTLLLIVAISVALNLFFLGVVAARAWQRAEWRSRWEGHAPSGFDGRHGPRPPRGEAFRWLSDAERAELRPRRKALRGLRHEAEDALRAEQFDTEKFRAALAALRLETAQIQGSVHELLIRRAGEMSVDERRRLADSNFLHDEGR